MNAPEKRTASIPRIAGAGICCLDRLFVSRRPAWGEITPVDEVRVQGGGLTATALVAAARLGDEGLLLSYLGRDETGDIVASELEAEGIDLAGVVRAGGVRSPFSFIHVDRETGERTIFHHHARGTEEAGFPDLSPIAACDALLVDDYYPRLARAAAEFAARAGVPVVADVVSDLDRDLGFLRFADVLIAPRKFASRLGRADDLDAALEAIHALGPATAVITLGAEGWVYSARGAKGRGRAFEVEVVDTTGAGDAFHGAFAHGLARKWSVDRAAEFAAAVAALKCGRIGGRTGLPSLAATLEFLRARGRLDWGFPD